VTDEHGQATGQRLAAKPRGGRGFGLPEGVRRRIRDRGEKGCAQRMHRKCRKAVVSGQWPVASGQWPVVSCQFSGVSSRRTATAEAAVAT